MDNWSEVTKQFVELCDEKGCTNRKQVKKVIKEYLESQYKGKVPQARINMFVSDFTESVCIAKGFKC